MPCKSNYKSNLELINMVHFINAGYVRKMVNDAVMVRYFCFHNMPYLVST
jgi:hypothetical protein